MRPLSVVLCLLAVGCERDLGIAEKVPVVPDAIDTDLPAEPEPDPVPDIEVSPDRLDFGAWLQDCPSTASSVFIRNVGGAPLEVSEIAILGDGRFSFEVVATPGTLAPGEELEALVTFTPNALEVYDLPYLAIRSDDPDEGVTRVPVRGEGAPFAEHTDTFVQSPADAVDVLFSIDNSGSMSSDIAALGAAFDTFIQSFVTLGLDYHIAVMTADPDCPEFLGPVISPSTVDPQAEFIRQIGLGGACGGEAAFGATQNALQPGLLAGANAGFLRTDANLAIVALSDEPEQSERPGALFGCSPPVLTSGCMSVSAYVNFLVGLKNNDPGKVTFSGIVAPRSTSLLSVFGGSCDIAQPAPRYHQAINATGGVFGDLCQLDLDPFLRHLSLTAAGLDTRYTLTRVPTGSVAGDFTVEVGGRPVSPGAVNGYTYDPATQTIELHGNAIPEPGEAVVVTYEAEGACQ